MLPQNKDRCLVESVPLAEVCVLRVVDVGLPPGWFEIPNWGLEATSWLWGSSRGLCVEWDPLLLGQGVPPAETVVVRQVGRC